jgi:hypothetical protein
MQLRHGNVESKIARCKYLLQLLFRGDNQQFTRARSTKFGVRVYIIHIRL